MKKIGILAISIILILAFGVLGILGIFVQGLEGILSISKSTPTKSEVEDFILKNYGKGNIMISPRSVETKQETYYVKSNLGFEYEIVVGTIEHRIWNLL